MLSNQRARNVPQNGAQTNYVTQVPHLGHRWGTKLDPPQDGDKFTDFWVDLMKILFLAARSLGLSWYRNSMAPQK